MKHLINKIKLGKVISFKKRVLRKKFYFSEENSLLVLGNETRKINKSIVAPIIRDWKGPVISIYETEELRKATERRRMKKGDFVIYDPLEYISKIWGYWDILKFLQDEEELASYILGELDPKIAEQEQASIMQTFAVVFWQKFLHSTKGKTLIELPQIYTKEKKELYQWALENGSIFWNSLKEEEKQQVLDTIENQLILLSQFPSYENAQKMNISKLLSGKNTIYVAVPLYQDQEKVHLILSLFIQYCLKIYETLNAKNTLLIHIDDFSQKLPFYKLNEIIYYRNKTHSNFLLTSPNITKIEDVLGEDFVKKLSFVIPNIIDTVNGDSLNLLKILYKTDFNFKDENIMRNALRQIPQNYFLLYKNISNVDFKQVYYLSVND